MKYYNLILIFIYSYNLIVQTLSFKCSRYQCLMGINNLCAFITMNEKFIPIRIFNPSACNFETEYCSPTEPKPQENFIKVGECKNRTENMSAFPGEFCSKDQNCIVGQCDNGKCPGGDNGSPCKSSIDCTTGYYCKLSNDAKAISQCTKLLPMNSACSSTEECQNDLLCVNSKCLQTNSFNIDDTINISEFDKKYELSNYLCKSGFTSLENKKCLDITYVQNDQPTNDLVVCDTLNENACIAFLKDKGGKLNYFKTNKCICGMNETGIAYCPSLINDREVEADLIKFIIANNNICHTLNRKCYLNNISLNKLYYEKTLKLQKAATLGAPSCIYDILKYPF